MGAGRTENGDEKEKQKPKISKEEQDRLDAIHASYASYFRQKYGTILKRLDDRDEEPEIPQEPNAAVLTTMATRTKLLPDGIYEFSATPHDSAYRDKNGNALFTMLIQNGSASPRPPLTVRDYEKNRSLFLKNFKEQMWGCMAALATAKGVGSFELDLPAISRPPHKYDIDRLNALLELAQTSKFGVRLGPNAQEVISLLPVHTRRSLFSQKLGQKDYLGYVQQLNAQHQQSAGGRILSYGRHDDMLSNQSNFNLNDFYKNDKGEEKFGAERLAGLSDALDKMESRLKSLDSLYTELNIEADRYKQLIDEYETKSQDGQPGAEEALTDAIEGLEQVAERRERLLATMEKESDKLTQGIDALEVEFSDRSPATKYDKPQTPEREAADQQKKGELKKRFDDMSSLKTKALGGLPGEKLTETKKTFEEVTTKANDLNEKRQKQSNQRNP